MSSPKIEYYERPYTRTPRKEADIRADLARQLEDILKRQNARWWNLA